MAPKLKSSDDGNWYIPERSCKVFLLSEKVKILNLIRKKESHAKDAKIYGNNESSNPSQCGSFGWALSHKLKGCQFNPWSGHMPGL